MTERIYYTDPYAAEFDANVVSLEPIADNASRHGVVLDRTAFYPTSGGQPFDTGTLGTARVVDVVDRDDDSILHVVEGAISTGPVHGAIDWARRFEHMQQHTGQHVLSAAFDHLLNVRTVSFHLGSTASTIDLAREVSTDEIARAERDANRVVWEDRPVAIRFADAADAATLGLRKESKREGVLRVIDVENFDVSACGGTHVGRTGAIGMIAIAGSERFKGGTRLEFLCGRRALAGFNALRDSVAGSVRLLSVLPTELPAAIERAQAENRDLKGQIKGLRIKLAAYEAHRLLGAAERIGSARAVVRALTGWDANSLKEIAGLIAFQTGFVAILVSVPTPSAIVIARSADVAVDCAAILKQLIAAFGGKGGGRSEFAQGAGLDGNEEAMLAAARAAISG